MSRFVIDAPTLLHIVASGLAVSPGHQLVAPHTIRSQALDRLFDAVRNAELTEKQALHQHLLLTQLKIRLLGDRVSRATAWRIARDQGWEDIYGAEYLAVTRLQADFFVSVDPVIRARATGLVPIADVEALTAD